MRRNRVLACTAPGARWELGDQSDQAKGLVMLGWTLDTAAVDGGMPQSVGLILCRALTSTGRVTFPSSESGSGIGRNWTHVGDDLACSLGNGGVRGMLKAAVGRVPTEVVVVSTMQPARAARMFEDSSYPWWMRGQVALISDGKLPPPEIDRPTLLGLIEDDWIARATSLRIAGICAVMRPGVDGDVAGILALSEVFRLAFLAQLDHHARIAGFDFELLPEDAFVDRLAAQ